MAASASASASAYLSLVRSPSPSPCPASGQVHVHVHVVEKRAKCWRLGASRREAGVLGVGMSLSLVERARALGAEEEAQYERETREVISRVRGTIEMEKGDPNSSTAVAALREASNNWVAKYRRDKQLAGKPSFSNMYSVLNAISGHYISFGPTAPIPSKRKARILEEVDTAEKALSKGR